MKKQSISLLLVLVMCLSLLSGCSGGQDGISGAPDTPGASASREEDKRDLSQFAGAREGEDISITEEELDEIRMSVEMMEEDYRHNAGEDSSVDSRDWTRYASPLGTEGLTEVEAAFYSRLEELGRRYIVSGALDGIEKKTSAGTWYVSDRVLYGDLGLVKAQARNIVQWFLYNNPQYYFFTGGTSSDSAYITLQLYDFVAGGEDRAKVTNELFDKLDGWIGQVDSQAATTWQKELLANNLLCQENVYEFNDYDQSLYSAVMTGKTVCAGFAKSFCAMMNALGVDATAGLSYNKAEGDGHAWNVVRFDDGNCYCVDVCWNNYDDSKEGYQNDYFNVGEADSKDSDYAKIYHTYEDGYEHLIPAIAAVSYSPTPYDTDTKKSDGPVQPIEPPPPAQSEPTPPDSSSQLVELVKTGPTAPDVTVDDVMAYSIHVTGCPQNSRLYLFPDGNYREDEKTSPMDVSGKGIYCSGPAEIRPDTTYYLGVRVEEEADGQWQYSDWTYFTVTTPKWDFELETPKNVKASATVDSITLTFDPVKDATSYSIYRYEDESCLWVKANNMNFVSETELTLKTGIKPGTTYYFGIIASGPAGTSNYKYSSTGRSDIVYLTVTTPEGHSDKFTDPVKSGPTALDISIDEVTPWGFQCSFERKKGFKYYAAVFTDGTYQEKKMEKSHFSTGWSDGWIFRPDTTYYLGIYYSEKVDGKYQDSDWTYFTITTPEREFKLEAPRNVKVTAEPGNVTAAWDPVEGADHYWVMLYGDGTCLSTHWPYGRDTDETTYTCQWTGLKAGETYYWGVYASGDSGNSDITYFTTAIPD